MTQTENYPSETISMDLSLTLPEAIALRNAAHESLEKMKVRKSMPRGMSARDLFELIDRVAGIVVTLDRKIEQAQEPGRTLALGFATKEVD